MKENNKAASSHSMPCSIEAERRVLGAVLLGNLAFEDLSELYRVSHTTFCDDRHRDIFAMMHKLSLQFQRVDVSMLCDCLRSGKQLDTAGGEQYVRSLTDQATSFKEVEQYIDVIRKKEFLRRIICVARSTMIKCRNEPAQIDFLLGEIEQKLLAIPSSLRSPKSAWKDAVDSAAERINKKINSEDRGLPTGIPDLDRILKGMHGGELIVLAGKPSADALALKIIECLALGRDIHGHPLKGDHARSHPVGIISLSLSAEGLAHRMICSLVDSLPSSTADPASSEEETTEKLNKAVEALKDAPVYVCDERELDVISLRAHARRMMKHYHPDLVVVDGSQLLTTRSSLSEISCGLKDMAGELGVPVIVLCELTDPIEKERDGSRRPKLADLYDRGTLVQDADVVLLLHRPDDSCDDPTPGCKSPIVVSIAKHNGGMVGDTRFNFDDVGI